MGGVAAANHFASAKRVPRLIEKSPAGEAAMCEVHQYVPPGLSVYW